MAGDQGDSHIAWVVASRDTLLHDWLARVGLAGGPVPILGARDCFIGWRRQGKEGWSDATSPVSLRQLWRDLCRVPLVLQQRKSLLQAVHFIAQVLAVELGFRDHFRPVIDLDMVPMLLQHVIHL